jgi:uroporphyrinogen decarboxylase
MMTNNLPLRNPQPDYTRAISGLLGLVTLERPPLVEYIVDEVVMRAVMRRLDLPWLDPSAGVDAQTAYLKNFAQFYYSLGYSLVKFEQGLPFPSHHLLAADTAQGTDRSRSWSDQHRGTISSWEDFERYAWPRIEDYDFSAFEQLNRILPEGMGLMLSHSGGPYETLAALMSYEGLCLVLHDDFSLVKAVADRVGALMEQFYAHLLTLDRVAAIFPGDDMGFRTTTLIGPEPLRQLTLPWHRRYAEMTHQHGLPYFLHSCGNLARIYEDLIEQVRIDGKHSYEDAILPVEQFQERYGSRIAVLGGLDVHTLAAGTPADVRQRTLQLIETCGARGRYAIGSGNSIPSYIPPENYLAMIEAAVLG